MGQILLLAAWWIGVGAVKVVDPSDIHISVYVMNPAWARYIGIAELACGLGLFVKDLRPKVLIITLLLLTAFMVFAIAFPSKSGRCGCFGAAIHVSDGVRMVLLGLVTLVTATSLWYRYAPTPGRSG